MTSVSVLGAGAWGTALALTCYRAGNTTLLWTREAQHAEEMRQTQENKKYLPQVSLPQGITVTPSLEEALQAPVLLLTCPAQALRSFLTPLQNAIPQESYLLLCSKGIEIETGKILTEVVKEFLPNHSAGILSGPTFAHDVAEGLPAAATLATREITTARWLASSLSCPSFRLYPSTDSIGVALGGAVKNVIAIAAGLVSARGLGESARAALVTRGLAEAARLGLAMGAQLETFMGLSGLGDMLLSCASPHSRNMSFGLKIGKLDSFVLPAEDASILTEGVFTAKAIHRLASEKGLELPIIESVYRILYEKSSIEEEINLLLSRPLKIESFGG